MGKETSIQWADSSLNLMMGCDGCELWNDRRRSCYAGRQIDGEGNRPGMAGRAGWPISFDQPKLFLERLAPALKWKDLTGTKREAKPWLDDMPRLVFLNDMGDTFTESAPLGWLKPIMPLLAASPHQWLILTKRPRRFLQFSRECPLPPNVWPGTTVTDQKTAKRADYLREITSGGPKWISAEPLWEELRAETFMEMKWVIFGGESGPEAKPCKLDWIRKGIEDVRDYCGMRPFVKQLGGIPMEKVGTYLLKDSHGGEWNEWPMDLRIREMPKFNLQPQLL